MTASRFRPLLKCTRVSDRALAGWILSNPSTRSAIRLAPSIRHYSTPPKPPHQQTSEDPYDVSSAKFRGLTTYANLPYVHGLAKKNEHVEPYDIAVLGAPFDTGVTARPGARYGPTAIRSGSQRIAPDFAYSVYTGRNIFREWATIVDCGDAPMTVLDNTVALRQLDRSLELVSNRRAKSRDYPVPRVLTLGGDHTITLCGIRNAARHFGPVSVIHFDSHLDTWDPSELGSESDYAAVNHGSVLHWAAKERLLRPHASIHAGIRGPLANAAYDLAHDAECGFAIVTARDIDGPGGARAVADRLRARVGGGNVYISVDIDVLDPAFAPGTGTPEVGGWSTRELLGVLDGLSGLRIVGGDVVEVAPAYDTRGETTGLAAAEVAQSLLGLMVRTPVAPPRRGV